MSGVFDLLWRYRTPTIWLSLLLVFTASQLIGGETWDEAGNERGLEQTLAFGLGALSGRTDLTYQAIVSNMEFYGVLPSFIASAVFHTAQFFGASPDLAWEINRFTLHANAMAWGAGTAYITFAITKLLTGDNVLAWLAAVFLMLYPTWLGHSFFNFKDLPLAFFFSLSLYGALLSFTTDDVVFKRGVTIFAIAAVGACAVKLASVPLLLTSGVALLYNALAYPNRWSRLAALVMAAFLALISIYVLTPAAWLEPIKYGIENLAYMSRHEWPGCSLTAGTCMRPLGADWSAFAYLARWSLVQLPLLVWALLAPATVFVVFKGQPRERFLLAAIVVPLAMILIRNSSLYNGLRHLLFLIPPIFSIIIVATAGTVNSFPHAWRAKGSRIFRGAFIASIALFAVDSITLFPYGYTYINEFARPFVDHRSFQTDYLGYSLREAAHIANREANRSATPTMAYLASPQHLVTRFVLPSMSARNPETLDSGTPYLRIFISQTENLGRRQCERVARSGAPTRSPGACRSSAGCDTIGAVRRQLIFGRPLVMSYVQRCVTP